MKKFGALAGLGLALSLSPVFPTVAQTILGPDAAACRSGALLPAALVRVHGFKDHLGNLRIQLYSDVKDDFLASGKKLRRVEIDPILASDMEVCIALPSTGRFALAVLHDRDGDHKLSIWRDGVGFSNNPKIRFGKPDLSEVLFDVRAGVTLVDVVLNYRSGFGVRPLTGG